jgi:hypothetical protein
MGIERLPLKWAALVLFPKICSDRRGGCKSMFFFIFFLSCCPEANESTTDYGGVEAHAPEGAYFFLDKHPVYYCEEGATDCNISLTAPGRHMVSAKSYDFGYVDFFFEADEQGEVFEADWTVTAEDGDWFYGLDPSGEYWCDGGYYSANSWYTDIGLASYDMDGDGLEELAVTGLPLTPIYNYTEFSGVELCGNGATETMNGAVAEDLLTIVAYHTRCDGQEDVLNYQRQAEEF